MLNIMTFTLSPVTNQSSKCVFDVCVLQDTTQCQAPARPSPAATSSTSLLCLKAQVGNRKKLLQLDAQVSLLIAMICTLFWCHTSTRWLTLTFLHSGLLLHSRGSVTGKRERESERDGSGEKDPASCSVHKMQRQST